MPGTTPNRAFPIPSDSDALADGAKAVRDLGNAVDDAYPYKMRRGHTSGTTDASGDLTITHGLGATPTAVVVSNGLNNANHALTAHTFTSTTFKVRIRQANTAAALATVATTIDWVAFS